MYAEELYVMKGGKGPYFLRPNDAFCHRLYYFLPVAGTKRRDQGVLYKEVFILSQRSRMVRPHHGGEAWQ